MKFQERVRSKMEILERACGTSLWNEPVDRALAVINHLGDEVMKVFRAGCVFIASYIENEA